MLPAPIAGFLASWGLKLAAVAAAAAAVAMVFVSVKNAGRMAERAESMAQLAEIRRRQDKAAAKLKPGRRGVIESLERGEF